MTLGNSANEASKHAQLHKNVFEAEWIRGCYQLTDPGLPEQEKTPEWVISYKMTLFCMWYVTIMCNAACAEGTLLACEHTCPALRINHYLGVHFRNKFCEKLSTSKLPLLFIHEHVLWKCLCLIPETGFHPTDTASSIAARCMKVPEQMG